VRRDPSVGRPRKLLDGRPLLSILRLALDETHRTRIVLVATITNIMTLISTENKEIMRANESTRFRCASLPQIVGVQDPGVFSIDIPKASNDARRASRHNIYIREQTVFAGNQFTVSPFHVLENSKT